MSLWSSLFWLLSPVAVLACVVVVAWVLGVFRYISNSEIGIVEKLWSGQGSVRSGLIALNGEAGFQPDVLRGGFHFFFPLQYRVHRVSLVTIPQGKIGYVFARDGKSLPPTQTLASNPPETDFQNTRAFLASEVGGQKGPQRKILREGTYAINLAQFAVITRDRIFSLNLEQEEQAMFKRMAELIDTRKGFEPIIISDASDQIGVVTIHDGPSLTADEIIAPTVGEDSSELDTYHNNFQDPEKFLRAGGRRGRQLQVLVEGTYHINRLFATVEMIPKTTIEVGNVGVVVSYTGKHGKDISGSDYKHGELVERGERGVWVTPLLPGKYAFNTFSGRVISVPTTNFILKWNKSESGAHKFDENLAEVDLITKDAFEPSLPLSVVVHIDYKKAPLVVQRFGDIKRLVEQTLDPMVSAYFKNIGQTRTLIELLQDRSAIQQQSSKEMKSKFDQYNLELLEVLIGTPTSTDSKGPANVGQIEQILTQLRSRQIAAEQIATYGRQEAAAVKERELREAEARAKQQTAITESELSITVQTNQGKADYARAQQQASQIQILAGAEGEKTRILAEGEAKKIASIATAEAERAARIGIAQAMAVQEQVRAYGGPRFQLTQSVMSRFAEAIQQSQIDVVPKILIQGQGGSGASSKDNFGGSGSSLVEALLAMLMSDKIESQENYSESPMNEEAAEIRRQMIRQMNTGKQAKQA